MIKILHIYAGNLFGGIETLLVTLARERQLCPAMEPQFGLCFEGRLSRDLANTGVKVHQLGSVKLRYPWQVMQARAELERVIDRESIDLVICHACWPQVIFGGAVKRIGKPLVFWCHDTPQGTSWLEKLAKLIQPDLVIANSQYTHQHLHLLYPNIANRVIYYPISPILTENPQLVRQQIRQQLGTDQDTTAIIQVSRLERWKGHTLTIAALGELKDLPNWECWMVGGVQRESEQDYWAELHERVQQLGLEDRIRFLGQRQDVADLLVAADIFCQPNLGGEPFGIVFAEALSAGLPVVTVAMGGGGEIVTPACGYAVPPGQIGAIAGALRELVDDPTQRAQFTGLAIQRATELCDPRQQLETISQVTTELSTAFQNYDATPI